jgi:hypothetical protein
MKLRSYLFNFFTDGDYTFFFGLCTVSPKFRRYHTYSQLEAHHKDDSVHSVSVMVLGVVI